MIRVVALSSYGLGDGVGAAYPPVREFARALGRELAAAGRPAPELFAHHSPGLGGHAEYLRRLPFTPDLVYACGSSVMEVAARELAARGTPDVPLVYWGSHIEDGGELVNPRPAAPSIAGVELPMPLYHSHRQFRLLKSFFPKLERVHCVFSVESAFVQGERRERYRRALAAGAGPWLPCASEHAAFPGLGRLGELVDVEVFEHPCEGPAAAAAAARAVGGCEARRATEARACLISCIDCLHVDGAAAAMARAAHEARVPFVGLNFGAFTPEHGPLLSFESDLTGAARLAAGLARGLLAGERPAGAGRTVVYDQFFLRLCPGLAEAWGLAPAGRDRARVERSFRVVEAHPLGATMSQDLEPLIKSLFAKIQKVPADSVDMNADLFEVYGVDSLRAAKLLSALEVELEIELPSEQTGSLRTLSDVMRCARGVLETSGGAP